MEFALLLKGGTYYKLLHMNKDKLRLQETLIRNVVCSKPAIQFIVTNLLNLTHTC